MGDIRVESMCDTETQLQTEPIRQVVLVTHSQSPCVKCSRTKHCEPFSSQSKCSVSQSVGNLVRDDKMFLCSHDIKL